MTTYADEERRRRRIRIRMATKAVARAERAVARAKAERDRAFIEAHGPLPWTQAHKAAGYLSYTEIAEASGPSDQGGVSKGWVTRVIQEANALREVAG